MIKTKAIDHVYLYVKSITDSKKYFEDVFGFSCKLRNGHDNMLVVESENVHFFMLELTDNDEFIAKQHISFQVDSIDEVHDNLRKLGVFDFTSGEVRFFQYNNYKWCEWLDSNGIRVECVEIL